MKYYSLNEVQTKIKDKNKCRALRAVPFHPFSCCLIFYLSLCVFPDVLNRSGEDCLMRKQTFASARLFRDSRSWKWNWSDLKRVEKAISMYYSPPTILRDGIQSIWNLSGWDTSHRPNNPAEFYSICHVTISISQANHSIQTTNNYIFFSINLT